MAFSSLQSAAEVPEVFEVPGVLEGAGPEGAGPEGAGPEGAGPEGAGPEAAHVALLLRGHWWLSELEDKIPVCVAGKLSGA